MSGWQNFQGPYAAGVQADILNYHPWVGYAPGATTAWVMLTTNDISRYAQIGWWEDVGGNRYTFIQWQNSPGNYQTAFWSPEPTNTTTFYRVTFDPATKWAHFEDDGSGIVNNANRYLGWTPNAGEMYGELHTLANQMPGGSTVPEAFTVANIELWNSTLNQYVWGDFSGTRTNASETYFGVSVSTTTSATVWDKACTT